MDDSGPRSQEATPPGRTVAPSPTNLWASLPMVVVLPPPLTPTMSMTPGLASPKFNTLLPPLPARDDRSLRGSADKARPAQPYAPTTYLGARLWAVIFDARCGKSTSPRS